MGWIALEGGLAGGADVLLLTQLPYSLEAVAERCRRNEAAGSCTVICIDEGARQIGTGLTVAPPLPTTPIRCAWAA